jgi:hypothetical protein
MKNLFKSLAAFQQEVPVIHKGTQGYGYSYADLPKIFEVINPLLQKHGLGFTQLVDNNSIKTILFHVESGETIDSCTYVPFDSLNYEEVIKVDRQGNEVKANVIKGFEGMNKAQAIGSMITYFRRYALSAILGIVTDKDTDGSSVKTTNVVKKPTIQGERFLKAVEAIRNGEFTAEELQAKFELNEVQQKSLLLL